MVQSPLEIIIAILFLIVSSAIKFLISLGSLLFVLFQSLSYILKAGGFLGMFVVVITLAILFFIFWKFIFSTIKQAILAFLLLFLFLLILFLFI